ncbi:hypothetical protein SAMN05421847_1625 [Halpernia humi]|uniref:Uncharacterized protein n=1 Tax=Halpernia humi TaxID=493375 RepID=A0A1H5Y175_9FLAO|nr:hypothetical protein SAMN05421847_1625 [Halpernia humi]
MRIIILVFIFFGVFGKCQKEGVDNMIYNKIENLKEVKNLVKKIHQLILIIKYPL